MENWVKVRTICQEDKLLSLIEGTELTLQHAYQHLYMRYSCLQALLSERMIQYCGSHSMIMCQLISQNTTIKIDIPQSDDPFVKNLQILKSKPHKRLQLIGNRTQIENEFYEQRKKYLQIQLPMLTDSAKKIKKEDHIIVREYLNKLAYALDQDRFVIISGPQSSGKSQIVSEYIQNSKQLTLYMDQTIDFNTMIGQYVCTETIGVFKHAPGPLLHAANIKAILILKNYQEASQDFQQQLRRAINLNYVVVSGKKHYLHNLKVIATTNHHSQDTLQIESFTVDQLTEYFDYLHPCLKKLLWPIINLQVLLKDLKKLLNRWEYHLRIFFQDQGIQNNYLPEQLRIRMYLEVCELLPNVSELIKSYFDIDFQYSNYNPRLQLFDGYMEFFKLGQIQVKQITNRLIVYNQYSTKILEQIISTVLQNEPCLLIGDTGCGKTTLTQHCAELFNKKLHVFNLSEGSDCQDLIGGFRPLNSDILVKINFQKFLKYFSKCADSAKNIHFTTQLHKLYQSKKHQLLTKCMIDTTQQCMIKYPSPKWSKLLSNLKNVSEMSFYFLTGNLIKAMKHGDWVLIDEINLANNELLQKLLPAIEKTQLLFFERGDSESITIHPEFRLFGCMNPGSDIGKKELPQNIKNKFTVLNVPELTDRNDLIDFIRGITDAFDAGKLADLYQFLKQSDRTYSLRNLSRALIYIKKNLSQGPKAIFNGLSLGFGSGMNSDQLELFYQKLTEMGIQKSIPQQHYKVFDDCIELYQFKLPRGPLELTAPDKCQYLITPSNLPYLLSCLRCLSGSGLPVLLEGPTSGGKTSLVYFLAKISGQRCHRINNHQNTEVEEYLGTYAANGNSIQFQEGLLVQALKNGDWIILDELNLARSEILENLNRLLDDNQELFLPETQSLLKPHQNFRIFATQNPISYSGRKQLSKAFRNRFIEIQVQEINSEDLTNILITRCPYLPPTYIPLLRQSQQELNILRSSEQIFMQSTGMITLRDLIKWGSRMKNCTLDSRQAAAMEGYCIIAERIRDYAVKTIVKLTIERIFKVVLNPQEYYQSLVQPLLDSKINWNQSFTRMAALTLKCVQNKEPALLIGSAGIGKTTLVSLLAEKLNTISQHLVCHQYLEISDFVGALRPGRDHQSIFQWQDGPLLKCFKEGGIFLIDEINMCPESVLEGLNSCLEQPSTLTVNDQFYSIHDQQFAIIGAMNPSGDWGKKELTPALRSRFTEIFAENPLRQDDLQSIVQQYNPEHYLNISQAIQKLNQHVEITFRDLLILTSQLQKINDINEAFDFAILQPLEHEIAPQLFNNIVESIGISINRNYTISNSYIGPYFIGNIDFKVPTENLYKIARSLQYSKPIMIQGPPQCGKSFIVQQLARINNQKVISIIFDEQSDLQELLGTDQPNSSLSLLSQMTGKQLPKSEGQFRFVEGPLLQGLIEGHWIILKNLNLAPQNVLEGLNSILDHRKEIYIPELARTIYVHQNCRIFAIQNPHSQGEGRKGLPQSFLNRFIRMHFQSYSEEFLSDLFPSEFRNLKLMNEYLRSPLKEKFLTNEQLTFKHVDHTLFVQQKQHFSDLIEMIPTLRAVHLYGCTGKQHLVSRIADYCQKKLVHVILSKQTDSLELLGQYEQQDKETRIKMYEKFGAKVEEDEALFTWRFSALVEAAYRGYWVLVDHVDELNKEIIPKLMQFSEQTINIFGEDIKIHQDFRIWTTGQTKMNNVFNVELQLDTQTKDYENDIISLANQFRGILNVELLASRLVRLQNQVEVMRMIKILKQQSELRTISDFELNIILNRLIPEEPKILNYYWNHDIITRIFNPLIMLRSSYDPNQNIIQNNVEFQRLQVRRVLNEHYSQYFQKNHVYCENFSFQESTSDLLIKVQDQVKQELGQQYSLNLFTLDNQSKSMIEEIMNWNANTQNLLNSMLQLSLLQNLNINRKYELIVIHYLIQILRANNDTVSSELVLQKSDLVIETKMLRNLEEWNTMCIYQYLTSNSIAIPEAQEIKLYFDICLEQHRYADLADFLSIFKKTFKISIDLCKEWLQSLVNTQVVSYNDMVIILDRNQLLYNYAKLCRQDSAQLASLQVNQVKLFLNYSAALEHQDLQLSIKAIQQYIDYRNIIQEKSIFELCSLPALDFEFIQIFETKLKYKAASEQQIQEHILTNLISAQIIELPYYLEAITRFQRIQSYQAFYPVQTFEISRNQLLTTIQKLLNVTHDQLIQISSKEVQLFYLEEFVNELKDQFTAKQETHFLMTGVYPKDSYQIITDLENKIEKLKSELFIRNPQCDNISASHQFLEDINYHLRNIYDNSDSDSFYQLCDQFIIHTYDKYYLGFKDILKPLYELMSYRKTTLKEHKKYTDNGFISQLRQKKGLELLILAEQHLVSQEERDLFKMDDAKMYTMLSRKIEGMVVDQYTDTAKQDEDRYFEQMKDKEFQTFKQEFEFTNLTKDQLTVRVREELSSLDLLTREFLDYILENKQNLYLQKTFPSFGRSLIEIPDFQDCDLIINEVASLSQNNNELNVYRQALPAELQNTWESLMSIAERVRVLQLEDLFAENEVLEQLGLLIVNILQQRAFSTPFIRHITGVTFLLQKIELWNQTVPKIYHINLDSLTALVMKWRRIERNGWKSVLANKVQEFWSVESIIIFKLFKELQNNNLKALDIYLDESAVGNIEIRILMLKFLVQNLPDNLEYKKIIQQRLVQLMIYHEEYNSNMKDTVGMYIKEVQEYKKLVSWESKNYLIVQAAAEKMHGKLIKVQHRFRCSLNDKFKQLTQKVVDKEFHDSIECFVACYKPLPILTSKYTYCQKIETLISDSLSRMSEIKEAKSNAKILALRNFQGFIENFLGLRGSLRANVDLSTADLMLKNPHKAVLAKASNYYYKSLAVFKKSISQSYHKSIPQQQLSKSIALLHDFYLQIINLFKLISGLIIEDITIKPSQDQELLLYAKHIHLDSLNQFIKYPSDQTKRHLLKDIEQKFAKYDDKLQYNLLDRLKNKVQQIEISEVQQRTIMETDPKSEIVWKKYLDQLHNDENILQGEQKILISLAKHYNQKFITQSIENLEATTKLQYFMTVTFCNIMTKGFCQKDEEEGEDDGDGKMKEGTGVGEGKGQNNVTKDIEFEEQIAGQQGDQEQDQSQDNNEQDSKDQDEFSMENDFKGKNEAPEKKDEEEEEKDEPEKEDDDIDQGFSSVEEDDNENLKNNPGDEDMSSEEEDSKKRKKSDLEYNAEEEGKQKELQAEEKEQKNNSQKRNLKDLEESSKEAQSEKGSDVEENESGSGDDDQSEKQASEFGGKGGEQIEEMEEESNLDINQQQESLTMDEQEQQEQQEDMIEEEEIKFDDPVQDKQVDEDQKVQNQDIFDQQERGIDEEEQQDNEDQNKLFKDDALDDQLGENNDNGQQGQSGKQAEEQEQEGKGKEQGKQNNKEKMMKKLFETLEKHLDQKDVQKFKKDLNVQDEEGEEMEQEDNMHFQMNKDSNKLDLATNLPVFEQQQQKLKESFMNEKMELEDITDKQQELEEQDDNLNQDQTGKEGNQQKQCDQMNFENIPSQYQAIDIRTQKETDPDEIIKQFKRENHDVNTQWDNSKGLTLWSQIESEVTRSSLQLSEELKAILIATQSSGLKGDFKTGKRLNMKKIIPYIASNFRKDKIWLRRTQPQKRNYQIMLALDDSLSMNDNQVGLLSLQSLTSLSLALSKMEAGQIAIASIHEGMSLLHSFEQQFTQAHCPNLLGHFSFSYSSAVSSELSLMRFMRESIDLFIKHKQQNSQQICFIISDGKFNKKLVKPLCLEAESLGLLYVFIIMDREKQSIRNIKSTSTIVKDGKTQLLIKSYLEDFPYRYYIIIKDPNELNHILINILRQHYQLVEQ